MTFHVTVFPAGDGDCMLLSYGEEGARRHVLVDGGRAPTYPHLRTRLEAIREAGEELELLVLTHIDADHIEGVLEFARDQDLPVKPKRVWYNGYDQMGDIQAFSTAQGDAFSNLIKEQEWPLNPEFEGRAVSIEAKPGVLEVGGLHISLLSPNAAKLATMRQKWAVWRTAEAAKKAAAELVPAGVQRMGRERMPAVLDVDALAAPTPTDPEPPNGSSIAFVAEWGGRRILMGGDAHPDLLAASLEPLAAGAGGRLPIDLFKVSHHGSRGNTTREVVQLLDCGRFLISTDGKRHGHPDPEAIARLLAFAPDGEKTLYFNYRTSRTAPWDDEALKQAWGYGVVFGHPDGLLEIDI